VTQTEQAINEFESLLERIFPIDSCHFHELFVLTARMVSKKLQCWQESGDWDVNVQLVSTTDGHFFNEFWETRGKIFTEFD
jgi:hypothetical protein